MPNFANTTAFDRRRIDPDMTEAFSGAARPFANATGWTCRILLATTGLVASVAVSQAGESAHHRHSSPEVKSWIEGLTNDSGMNCCSVADGYTPNAVEWDIGARRYRIKVDGDWYAVPESAVIKGPNLLGHAVVWLYFELDFDEPYIRCFLPGPAS